MFQSLPLVGNLFNEGGPLFMYTNLVVLIAIIILLIKAFLNQENNNKAVNLIKHLSLFGLVWGFLGQMIGLISAFDIIQVTGNPSPEVLAGGIKVGLLSPTFGMVVFLIARLGLLILTFIRK